jgi:glycosyltransferase involved in cell wall biosynthesis
MLRRPVTHVFTHYRKLGGVESILRRLAETDARLAPGNRVLSLFESAPFSLPNVAGLGLRGLSSPKTARRRLATHTARHPRSGTWVYHNGWGLPFLAPADDAERRVSFMHSDWPGIGDWLSHQRGRLDGVVAVSHALLKLAETHLALPPERLCWLPVPIAPPADTFVLTPTPLGRPLVLGFCGRVVVEQKRLDRLPALDRLLRQAGIEVRWEILGDGPYRGELTARLPADAVFHGRQSGRSYWKALERWDLMVFTSDYEGLPISLIEHYCRGGVAVFPRIGCGGDDYVERVAPELLYRPGDLADATRAIRWYADRTPDQILELRRRAHALAAAHTGDAFESTLENHLNRITELPRLSTAGAAAARPNLGWNLPFGLLRRLPANHSWRRDLF